MLHKIERTGWAREATWRRFMEEVPCTYSMCVNLDITRLYGVVKAGGYRLFAALLYGLSRAVNRRAEFRMGLTADGEPGIYDEVHPCYTVFHPENETFTSVWQAYDPDFAAFSAAYVARDEQAAVPPPENIFHVSCLPWVSFTGFNLNLPAGFRDLEPLFTVGRFLNRTAGCFCRWRCSCITRPAMDTMQQCFFRICRRGWMILPDNTAVRRTGKGDIRMVKVLFVCHGNICRSPMAEFVFRDMVEKAGLAQRFTVASAATSREEIGNPVYPSARRVLAGYGIDTPSLRRKTARQLTAADYGVFDRLIGMDTANLRNMRRICGGDPDGKLSLLLDYTDRPGEVADPWYTGDFARTLRDVEAGCRGLLALLRQAEEKD